MFLSWNAFGFVCYMIYSGKADWAKDSKSKEELSLTPGKDLFLYFGTDYIAN